MLQIALCDDEGSVIDELYEIIENFFEDKEKQYQITIYQDGSELVQQRVRFDIIFLAIDMPILNGIATAKEIRTYDKEVKIVYITHYVDYWRCGYEVHAFDFIEKPIHREKIERVLTDWLELIEKSRVQVWTFETDKGSVVLNTDEIYYFMVTEKKTILLSTTKGTYLVKNNLSTIYQLLDKDIFFMTHRSFIVNMKYIKEIIKEEILLTNGDTVSLSQRRKTQFLASLHQYVRTKGQ